MKLEVKIDFKDLYLADGTVEELITNLIEQDIKNQLKKSDEYKKYINQITLKVIGRINLKES